MAVTEDFVAAFRKALIEKLLGIEQVDIDLEDDGRTVVLTGHTTDDDVTYVASFPVPAVEWRKG